MSHTAHIKQLLATHRKNLISIYNHAVDNIKPETLISEAVHIDQTTKSLTFKNYDNASAQSNKSINFDLDQTSLHVLGGGKCVLAMARGLARKFKNCGIDSKIFSRGHICVPNDLRPQLINDQDSKDLLNYINVECLFTSNNNMPNDESVRGTRILLDALTKSSLAKPIFIVLLSGGGSSCLSSPRIVDLPKKLNIIQQLMQKGANIVELNQVRRYFSSIKGGGLVRHIFQHHQDATVITMIISDVVGDRVEFIASGPTFVSSQKAIVNYRESMVQVLTKYHLEDLCPTNLSNLVDSSVTTNRTCDVSNLIIGNNLLALSAAKQKARELGYCTHVMSHEIVGHTEDVTRKMIDSAQTKYDCSNREPVLILAGGETTVEKQPNEEWGCGGRAQEMALDYMIECRKNATSLNNYPIDLFLAGTTDGQDGPTDVAACLVSNSELSSDTNTEVSLESFVQAKHKHDSYNFWKAIRPDWLIRTGLTNSNVMDIYMLMLSPNSPS